MGVSLSKDSQLLLKAASLGDADHISTCVASEPRLIKCTTLLKRSSALHIAASNGHVGVLRALVQPLLQQARQEVRGGERSGPAAKRLRKVVNARDVYYRTPFMIAAKKGHEECVRYLAESSSNVFACDREGNTCLHYAALYGHSTVISCLLDRCRDRGIMHRLVNKRNVSGYGALQYAVWGYHRDVVRQLLSAGADYTVVNDRIFDNWVPAPIGSSALHLAVIRGSYDIALLLLEHYARRLSSHSPGQRTPTDPRRITNIHGLDPSLLAQHMQRRRMARLLRPQLPIGRLFTAEDLDSTRTVGPSSLKALAAASLQSVLLDNLDQLEQQQQRRQQQQQASCADGQRSHKEPTQQQQVAMDTDGTDQLLRHDATRQAQQQQQAPAVSARGQVTRSSSAQLSRCNSRDGSGSGRHRARCSSSSSMSSSSMGGTSSTGPGLTAGSLQHTRCVTRHRRATSSSCTCNSCSCSSCSSNHRHAAPTADAPDIPSKQQQRQQAVAALARSASGDGSDSSSAGLLDAADGLCCVCLEELPSVQVVGCGHAICMGCARRLSEVRAYRPPPCPLCRRPISAFEWAEAATVGADAP